MKRFVLSTLLFVLLNLLVSWNSMAGWGAFELFRIAAPAVLFGIIVTVISKRIDSSYKRGG
ncbi:hypothetical protein [Paenibacillus mucilaginosus]|uniref:Uncharacterized protein n=2 Tax=Paenibacillus mucilaginosus TaxID=61624 RepID=I0BDE6_9BACL|nr:hypothetical protein [Paenibacillus mucilaginosus]AEI41959.1 hypothetical protein KNP414_03401 [Paenibacillus mucilaginosus KNP414]AFH60393.1 hypothetical protein B2K_06600 [Paenibacillus mucilaginosus K02]MCG7217855.1 hypothetical protein [Paenibacillus mucilaginosus]WDM28866.1 hypothetical protein KCX80_06580 [Paenibacillus mucilaginosus]